MIAKGQRWYCKSCGKRYEPKMGVVAELWNRGQASYLLADVPPLDLRDAKVMTIEKRLANAETAEELPARLPHATPMDKDNIWDALHIWRPHVLLPPTFPMGHDEAPPCVLSGRPSSLEARVWRMGYSGFRSLPC